MAKKDQTYDCTVINYRDKLIAIPMKDSELEQYMIEVLNMTNESTGKFNFIY